MKKIKISISVQILVFTLLVVFLPVGSILLLKTYEKQQLASLESSLVQQGRIMGASLSDDFSKAHADRILTAMDKRFDARIRVLDGEGRLLSDSARLLSPSSEGPESIDSVYVRSSSVKNRPDAQRSLVYRIASYPVRVYRRIFRAPAIDTYGSADFYNGKEIFDGAEVTAALRGRYGAITRISSGDQISVTLYSAIPVMNGENAVGVILVSRSTYRILQNLYELRRDIAKIFFWSLLAVFAVTVFFYFRISYPLKKLSRETTSCTDSHGHLISEKLTGSGRIDEIGELSRSFTILLKKLADRIRFTESFSADLSHEFKNPLAAIRSSAEIIRGEENPENREKYCDAITGEVSHLQMLLSGVRKLSQIDADDNIEKEKIPLDLFLQNISARIQGRHEDVKIHCQTGCQGGFVYMDADLLDRMTENLLENGASFGKNVLVISRPVTEKKILYAEISFHDDGPGVTPGLEEKIFERFYSSRKNKESHSGLGLSLVKSVCENAGGSVFCKKSNELGGACFCVKLKMTHF